MSASKKAPRNRSLFHICPEKAGRKEMRCGEIRIPVKEKQLP